MIAVTFPTLFEQLASGRARLLAWRISAAFLFSVFTALMARVALPLPWTPVPITGQTLAVFLTGFVLGPRLGPLAMVFYLLEGLAGFPVFATGATGLARILGPTGGYLMSYPLAAWLVGWLSTRGWDRRLLGTGLAMLLGSILIYLFGLTWLAFWLKAGGSLPGLVRLLQMGMLPFLPGDLLKVAAVMVLLPGAWRLLSPP